MRRFLPVWVVAAWSVLIPAAVGAAEPQPQDVFVFMLKSGGQIEGQWLNLQPPPADQYIVQVAGKGRLVLRGELVVDVVRRQPAELEYARIAPTFADTVEGQWALAEWCRQHGLLRQRRVHLERILQLDPQHVAAHQALGHTQVDGRWMTVEEYRKSQGYVLYRGRWRLPQEIQLIEARTQQKRLQHEWTEKLTRMSREQLLAVRDPAAVPALRKLLESTPSLDRRLDYIDVLGQIGTRDAAIALINASLNDPTADVFEAAVEQLVRLRSPAAVPAYLRALKDQNNVRVNRAARALARLGDRSVIEPLIDALVTTHQVMIEPPSGGLALSPTFVRGAGAADPVADLSGFSVGQKPRVVTVRMQNVEVLKALMQLSGSPGFGYDQQAWRKWAAVERAQPPPIELRKGP